MVENFSRNTNTDSKNTAVESTVESTDNRDLPSVVDDNTSEGFSITKKSASDTSKETDAIFYAEISLPKVEDDTSRKAEVNASQMTIRRTVSQPVDDAGPNTDFGTDKMAIRRVESAGSGGLRRSHTMVRYRRHVSVAGVHENDALDLHDESAEGTNNALDGDNAVGPLSRSLLDDVTSTDEQPLEIGSRLQTDEDYLLQEYIFRPILKSFSQVCLDEGKQ